MAFLIALALGYLIAIGLTPLVSVSLSATAWGSAYTYGYILGSAFAVYFVMGVIMFLCLKPAVRYLNRKVFDW